MSRDVAARLAKFAALPFVALLTPFLVLPVLARVSAPAEWLGLAVGQSIGAFGSLLVSQGYNLSGPHLVARAAPIERDDVLRRSVGARLLVFLPLAPLIAVVAAIVVPAAPLIAAVAAVAFLAIGLSNGWFAIGCSQVRPVVLFELLPRLAGSVVALPLLLLGGPVVLYPLLMLAANVGGTSAFLATRLGAGAFRFSPRRAVAEVRTHRHAMTSEVVAGTYTSLLVALVGASAVVTQAALYVSGDRLYKLGQTAVGTTSNALQGWFAEDIAERRRGAIGVQCAVGLVGLLGLGLLGAPISALLFGPRLAIPVDAAWLFGGALLMVSLNTATSRFVLLPAHRTADISVSVVIGAAIGVPAIVVGAHLAGAVGAAAALLLSEVVVTIVQAVASWTVLRRTARIRTLEGVNG